MRTDTPDEMVEPENLQKLLELFRGKSPTLAQPWIFEMSTLSSQFSAGISTFSEVSFIPDNFSGEKTNLLKIVSR